MIPAVAMDWSVFRVEGVLLGSLGVMFLVDLVRPAGAKSPAGWILILGSAAALMTLFAWPVADQSLWNGAYSVDALARFFKVIFLVSALLVAMASLKFIEGNAWEGEYYFTLGCSTVGMMLLVGAGELISMFVALELTSISLYLLASLRKGDPLSQEAGLKYLLIGAFSSALFLFGVSLLYAACGTTSLLELKEAMRSHAADPLMLFALVMILAGIGFKMATAPFHMWAPDVYQGGPTPMVAFASVASKAAGFAMLLRIMLGPLASLEADWSFLLAVMAALTLIVGSFVALPQTNIKRLLAYSSIAQAGYLLVGFVAGTERAVSSVLLYLSIYVFTNLGAFLSVIIVTRHTGSEEISDLAGLSRRSPLLALAFMLSLFSLAGIPPLGGFVGKLYLFAAAMEHADRFLWLVVLAVLLSIVSLFYYLQVVRQMYIEQPKGQGPIPVGAAAGTALVICMAGILVTGIIPGGVSVGGSQWLDLWDLTIGVAHRLLGL